MKTFLLSFIELGYMTLQFPHELSVYMERMPRLRIVEIFAVFIASLSFSTGIYQLRDYYSPMYFTHIFVLTGIFSVFFTLYFIFISSYFDTSASAKRSMSATGRALHARSILNLSSFVFWFFHPAVMILHVFNLDRFLAFPVFLFLFFWAFYVQSKALQYLYEITWKEFIKSYIFASFIAFIFPLTAVLAAVIFGVLS